MMKEQSQLLKGILEGCILKVIDGEESYGYGIVEQLRHVGFSSMSEGTIYPILLRLEKNGLLVATHRESPLGPNRKYYLLTQKGEKALHDFVINWRKVAACVTKLFEEGDADDHNPTTSRE